MLKRISRILTGSIAGLYLCFAPPAFAEETPDVPIAAGQSLAGNYLAARIADTDRDTESAAAFYRQAMLMDPENIVIKQRGFQALMSNGDFDEAVEVSKALAAAGELPEMARIVLATDSMRSKSWSNADKQLDFNWRSAVNRLVAGIIRGWAMAGDGRTDDALALVDGLKGPAWFDLFVQYHSGLIALHGGKQDDGITRLKIAFNNKDGGRGANQTYLRVIQSLTSAFIKSGQMDEAKELANTAVTLQPRNPVFKHMLDDVNNGKTLTSAVVTPQRGAAEVFLNMGTAINRDGGIEFARVFLQLANTMAPKQDAIVTQLADLYDQQKLNDRANELFAQIDEESPFYRLAQMEIAINLDDSEELEKSSAIFDRLLESEPDDLAAYLTYGSVLARHEKYDKVISILQNGISRLKEPKREHWSLYYRQGIAYERTKQWEKAEPVFMRALELYPDQPSVLNYLGYSWVDMGIKLEEGLKLIKRAVEIRPNDGYMVDSLGWAYYRLGRFQEAVEDLERAVALRPADPTINDHLGDAYWRTGRKLEATFQWRHALALDPPTEKEAELIEQKLETGLPYETPKLAKPDEKKPDNG